MSHPANFLREFLKLEAAGGILLVFTAAIAMIIANSALSTWYDLLIDVPVAIHVGTFAIAKPLLLWINDGLMAVFFLLVGLELKREILEGELSDRRQIALPAAAAVGGMIFPALVYAAFNYNDPIAIQGWAIPAATDIAFALGALALLGSRVPTTLKVLLVSIAIFDDLGAIIIIALFYTSSLSMTALILAAVFVAGLAFLNRRGVTSIAPYALLGLALWVAVLKSGVHATLAGVVTALFIPLREPGTDRSPLKTLEHDLHGVVAFFVLPVFAFANAGVDLRGSGFDALLHPVPMGVAAGLFFGKQLGVFGCGILAVKLGLAQLPAGVSGMSLYGVSLLCGIGFTMSLFVGSLAFEQTQVNLLFDERLGIISGSIVSGVLGYLVLRSALPADREYDQA
jgi:NhaA family Na+:H+ antiporter